MGGKKQTIVINCSAEQFISAIEKVLNHPSDTLSGDLRIVYIFLFNENKRGNIILGLHALKITYCADKSEICSIDFEAGEYILVRIGNEIPVVLDFKTELLANLSDQSFFGTLITFYKTSREVKHPFVRFDTTDSE
mgnify:CR=1 FL=1